MRRLSGLILFFVLITSLYSFINVNKRFYKFINRYYDNHLSFFPLEATLNGFNKKNDKLNIDISESFINKYRKFIRSTLDTLNNYDREFLNDDLKISYDLLQSILLTELRSLDFPDHLMPINHYQYLLNFIQMGSGEGIQPFNTTRDYDNFLNRMKLFATWVDTAIVNMRRGMEGGIVLPKRIALKTLEIIKQQASVKATHGDFYKPILNFPYSFSYWHKTYFEKAYKEVIEQYIIPAFRKLDQFLNNEYIYRCRDSIGLIDLPQGNIWYRHYIKKYTTTDMHPDTIMQIGIKEVTRIQNEICDLKKELEFNGNDFQFRQMLFKDADYSYSSEEMIERYRELSDEIYENLPEYFSVIPETLFEIRPINIEKSRFIGPHYQPSRPFSQQPGVFHFDARYIEKYGAVPNKSLFLHEVIPGHHFQMSLHRETVNLPDFQRFYWNSGYVEGWALYVENLGEELGVYTGARDIFTKLRAELLRAARLVVDVGIHYKGWSHQEAMNYFIYHTGLSNSFALREIDRYIVMPGQALSYKIGELIIRELRKISEKKLKKYFDLKEFHDEILKDGAMPLDVLEKKILKWILKKTEIVKIKAYQEFYTFPK